MKLLRLLVLPSLVLLTAQAEHRDDEREYRRGGPRVIVYEHAGFRGGFVVLYPGDEIVNLSGQSFPNGGGLNDGISSVRVEGGAEVYVFEHSRFRGQALRLTESARDLTGRLLPETITANWNDRISSLRVEGNRRRGGGNGGGDRTINPDVVIKRAFTDLLGREPSAAELRRFRGMITDQGWTERMVRDNLRTADEFRREAADRIIRRAYLEVLGREVDPSGLKQYRWALLEKNWTESDVRDALRRSDEYRQKADRR